jgi:hypothetical protein
VDLHTRGRQVAFQTERALVIGDQVIQVGQRAGAGHGREAELARVGQQDDRVGDAHQGPFG